MSASQETRLPEGLPAALRFHECILAGGMRRYGTEYIGVIIGMRLQTWQGHSGDPAKRAFTP